MELLTNTGEFEHATALLEKFLEIPFVLRSADEGPNLTDYHEFSAVGEYSTRAVRRHCKNTAERQSRLRFNPTERSPLSNLFLGVSSYAQGHYFSDSLGSEFHNQSTCAHGIRVVGAVWPSCELLHQAPLVGQGQLICG